MGAGGAGFGDWPGGGFLKCSLGLLVTVVEGVVLVVGLVRILKWSAVLGYSETCGFYYFWQTGGGTLARASVLVRTLSCNVDSSLLSSPPPSEN